MKLPKGRDKDFIDRTHIDGLRLLRDLMLMGNTRYTGPTELDFMHPRHDYRIGAPGRFHRKWNDANPIPGEKAYNPLEDFGIRMMERDRLILERGPPKRKK